MPTWILRKSVDDERVGDPHKVLSPQAMVRVVGLLTLEEQIACLLEEHETAGELVDGHQKIFRGEEVVGYLVVLSTELPTEQP